MTKSLSAFLILCGLFSPALATATDKSAGQGDTNAVKLLKQASQAVRKETYRGVIVYLRGGDTDTLKVLHRYHNGKEEERLVSMSGPAREVIRKGNEVTSILPGHKLVLVSERPKHNLLGSVSHFSPDQLKSNYRVVDKGETRTAGRDSRVIKIYPEDGFRYGYRMLIDGQTHLPLQLDLLQNDKQLEQMMFSAVSFPKSIPDSKFLPSYDVSGFRIVRHQAVHVAKNKQSDEAELDWHASQLPPGFKLAEDGVRQLSSDASVRQLLYTDGVATVSVFIAPSGLRAPLKGATSMGAVHAYGNIADQTQITVVGEVPAATVKQIAKHMVQGQAENGSSTDN